MHLSKAVPVGFLALLPQLCWAWETPERGSDLRADLMDAIRPHSEYQLGEPVVFVVKELRVSGKAAFASLRAMRPGGAEVDLYATPGYRRGMIDPDHMDGPQYQALYLREGRTWVAVHWALGATDVWYAGPTFCDKWSGVLTEFCE